MIREGIVFDGIAMILTGDIIPAGEQIFHRLVCTAVSVFQFFGVRTVCKGEKLMPQADAENRYAGFAEVRQLGNDSRVILRVAGTIA